MADLILLGALVVFIWGLLHFSGPPRRRQPHAPHPETDVPMADTPIILSTGGGDGS